MNEIAYTKLVEGALRGEGCQIIVNPGGKFAAHNPDRTIITPKGVFLIEFKGLKTGVTEGQRIKMNRLNVVHPCALILRAPGIIQTPNGITLIAIDPINLPSSFIDWLSLWRQRVLEGELNLI